MPKATPQWKNKMPEFIGAIACATEEKHIRSACEEIKQSVVDSYPLVPSSRRKPMAEIREAIRGRFPAQGRSKSEQESPPFPYFFTNSGKGSIPRWEHLAIKYLREEWAEKSDVESEVEPPSDNHEVVKQEEISMVNEGLAIIGQVGLSPDEMESVRNAIADTDVREWVKQAILQRANAINALRDRMDEDLSRVPSEKRREEKKYRTSPVACRELTSRAVRAIKAFNTQSPEYRWCITNKLISELTGNTVKAIAKAVEGMDIDSYNQGMDLQPVHNRLTKAAIGDIKDVVSIKDVLGVD